MQNTKSKILKALFAEAKKLGIDQETLRDDIAPGVINKRLSSASPQEIAKVLVYIHNRHGAPDAPPPAPSKGGELSPAGGGLGGGKKRYESSRAGLLEEIKDLAIARFGQDFIRPLNALCDRFKVEGYRSLRVNQAKAVKQTLIRLQRDDPRNAGADVRVENLQPLQPKTGGITFHKGRKGFLNQLGELDRLGDTYGDY